MRRRLLLLAIAVLIYVLHAPVCAQETGQPVASINVEYIREWLVLGPFFPDDLARDFPADVGGEANVDPREGGTVTSADGRIVTWKRYKPETGDTVVFYTDGIIEAENEAEEIYGTERLLDLVAVIDPSASAEGIIHAILQDVSDFVDNAEQYDDMTIVVVKRLGNSHAT